MEDFLNSNQHAEELHGEGTFQTFRPVDVGLPEAGVPDCLHALICGEVQLTSEELLLPLTAWPSSTASSRRPT